jgi:hypothetical protein
MSCFDVRLAVLASPDRARSLFTVRAAISSARLVPSPRCSALVLMCSYCRSRFGLAPLGISATFRRQRSDTPWLARLPTSPRSIPRRCATQWLKAAPAGIGSATRGAFFGDAEFEELLGAFTGAAREHIAFEETAVWPGLRTALNTERAAELGTQLAEGKKTAPTRPHPHTPPSPGALKAAGPVAAAADKLRDKMTGRGD